MRMEKHQLQIEIDNMRVERDDIYLQNQLQSTEIERLGREIETLTKRNEDRDSHNRELQEQLNSYYIDHSSSHNSSMDRTYRENMDKMKRDHNSLQKRYQTLEEDNESLRREMEQLQGKNRGMIKDIIGARKEYNTEIGRLAEENRKLFLSNTKLQADVTRLQSEAQSAASKLELVRPKKKVSFSSDVKEVGTPIPLPRRKRCNSESNGPMIGESPSIEVLNIILSVCSIRNLYYC